MKRLRKLAYLLLFVPVLGMAGCYSTPQSGEMGVVRNGGLFDNHDIRQIVCNGQGNTNVGIGSSTHYYPVDTQQRLYKLDTTSDADATPPKVRTEDGVNAQIHGTLYLNTAFNCSPQGKVLIKKFDTQFGTRTFGTNNMHAWDQDEGWSDFLNAVVQPVIDSNMREVIAGFECKELVSSCALVQNGGQQVKTSQIKSGNNQSNIAQIEQAINAGLKTQLREQLGAGYFTNAHFTLQLVDLPEVDGAIARAQQSFAQVSQAQAKAQQATQEAKANENRQNGYNKCPICGRIDQLKALPAGLKVLGGSAATLIK